MTEHEPPTDGTSGADGSLVDDLAKLVVALTGMVNDVSAAINTVAPPCDGLASCPLCRVHNLISQSSPEVAQHLTAATGSLLLALQAALKPRDTPAKQGFEHITLMDDEDAPREAD